MAVSGRCARLCVVHRYVGAHRAQAARAVPRQAREPSLWQSDGMPWKHYARIVRCSWTVLLQVQQSELSMSGRPCSLPKEQLLCCLLVLAR